MSRVGVSAHELEGIQHLDKNRQLATYLRAQRANSKHYAAEGKAAVSAWSPLATEDTVNKRNIQRFPSPQSGLPLAVGFDTPVLKPRTKLRTKETVLQDEKREKQKKQARSDSPEPPLERGQASKGDRKPLPKKSSTTKRPAISTSDDEHEARLAERRERKRAKRAIVKSPDPPLNEEEEPRNKSKGSKAKSKSKKEKTIPGFALMYGLNATNVGSNRLTMKPPINMGVFSKGKASAKTAAAKTAMKGQRDNLFSETAFLNKSKQKHQQDKENDHGPSDDDEDDDESSSSDDLSTHTAKKKPRKEMLKPITTKKPVKLRAPSPSYKSSSSELPEQPLAKGKKCTERAESIVWDIEREDASTLRTLSPTRKKASIVSGTIIVNAHRLHSLNAYDCAEPKQTSPTDVHPEEALKPTAEPDIDTSSVSLHPSDSASQFKPQAPYQMNTSVSRFFGTQPPLLDNPEPRSLAARTCSPLAGVLMDSERVVAVPEPAHMDMTNNILLSKGVTSYDNPPDHARYPEAYDEPFDVKGTPSGATAVHENAFGPLHLRPFMLPSVHLDFYEQLGEDSLLCVEVLEPPPIEIDLDTASYYMNPDSPYTRGALWCSEFDEQAGPLISGVHFDGPDTESPFSDSGDMLFGEQPCQYYEDVQWGEDSTAEYIVYGQEMPNDFELTTLNEDLEYELEIASDDGHYDYDDLPFGELSISNVELDMDCEMLEEEDFSELSLAPTESSIAPQRFYQGRAILLGLSDPGTISLVDLRRKAGSQPLSMAEKDVVRGLRGHWQPHRF